MRQCYKNDEASLYRMAQIVCRVINYCYLYNTYFRRHLDDAATKKITYRYKFLVNSLLLRLLLSYLHEVLFFYTQTQHRSEHTEERITTLHVFLSGDYSGNPPYAHSVVSRDRYINMVRLPRVIII